MTIPAAYPPSLTLTTTQGYDPELLFVECGRCGAPVLWKKGQATQVLASAGIDPLELDASCLLISDGCPTCSQAKEYSVQVYRIEDGNTRLWGIPQTGNA